MAKIIAFVLINFLMGCTERNFDCTKADYNKMFDYIKWCQGSTNSSLGSCQEQAKEIFCKEIFDPIQERSDSTLSW